MSFRYEYFIVDFDDSQRIMYLSNEGLVHLKTKNQVDQSFELFQSICRRYYAQGKFYLIIDMSNFIIEPDLTAVYAKNAKKIIEKYIVPGGVARFGHQITRLTVRRAYADYLTEKPQIFSTRGEACTYINEVIAANSDKLSAIDPIL
ncbi:MAG: hypothetical protein GY841_23265 [FCB group bacterium]|nr:hypothetical protein [FCB group bacterium]